MAGPTNARQHLREEPDALAAHVRICAGGPQQCGFLPRYTTWHDGTNPARVAQRSLSASGPRRQPLCANNVTGETPHCQWASKIAGFWALKIAGFWAPKVAGSARCPAEAFSAARYGTACGRDARAPGWGASSQRCCCSRGRRPAGPRRCPCGGTVRLGGPSSSLA